MKTIGIHDDTYRRLFAIQNKMEKERGRRVSFSEVIDELIVRFENRDGDGTSRTSATPRNGF